MAVAIQQLNARLQQQEMAVTTLTQARARLAQQVQTEHDRRARTARAGRSGRQTGDGDPVKYADWSFKLRPYFGAVDQRYQQELTTTETPSTPRLNTTLGTEESTLSTQMYYILVMTTAEAVLDKCHNAGVNEGFEAWEQFVMEWEPKLQTRYVGLLMNVLGVQIPTRFQQSWRRSREPCTTSRTNPQIQWTISR